MNCRLGRPKTVVFFLDRLENYKSTSKPRCTVHIHLGMAKRKLGKSHLTSDYSWESEVQVNLPSDVTDDTVLTLRVMDNKREVGSTSVQLFHLPFDTPHRTGREAFPSIPHKLEEPFRRNGRTSNGVLPYALLYSCWIRDVDGEPRAVSESKSSRTWKPLRALRKAFSRSNLTKEEDSNNYAVGGNLKKKYAKSMYDLTAVPTSAESEVLRANGMMLRPINLDEPCPPPRNGFRNATSLHNLAMSDFNDFNEPPTTAEQLVAWVHEQVPCPPEPIDGEEVLEPSIRDVEPREVIWGEENVLSIYGESLGNAGRDIERLTVCGLDVTESCYSDPPSSEIPYDHIMCHIHGDEDGLPSPRPGEPLRRGHVEILYKDGRHIKSMQRVTLLPPTSEDLAPTGTDSTGAEEDTSAPFDLDNFHPSSGVLQATQAMVAKGQFEAECQQDSQGLHVVVKPRVSSFSGHIDATTTESSVCHVKNSSMPHLGQCCPPEEELNEKEKAEKDSVQKRRKYEEGDRGSTVKQMKARRGSEKSLRGFSFPRFLSRSRLDLTEGGASCDLGQSGDGGEEEVEEDSMADSAYDTLQKLFRRGHHRCRRKCQSRSSSVTSADLIEENQKLKIENQNLKEDIEALWTENREQKCEVMNLRRKLHELTSAFQKHKSESDLHVNELMNLKFRLLADNRNEYLCID